MSEFTDSAFRILQEANIPLHCREITKLALEKGYLKSKGKTPAATMNARLHEEIYAKESKSRFVKISPSVFTLNSKIVNKIFDATKLKKSDGISTKQKGDIVEGRILELITLDGGGALSCYKPASDIEGIDLLVNYRNSKQIGVQIKSRYDIEGTFTANAKISNVQDRYSMVMVFCHYNRAKGDIDALWLVPAPVFIEQAVKSKNNKFLQFVSGLGKRKDNKWNKFLIDKRDLAKRLLEHINRL